jgi:lambda family phage portal protein
VQSQLNWLDRAIAWINPARGRKRAAARMAMEVLLAYEGAKTGRRTDGWITASGDANSAVGPDLPTLRERSRDLCRNNPHGARAKSIVVASTVGTQLLPQADTGNAALNKAIDEAFRIHCEECDADGQLDMFGLQRLAVEGIFESGGVLVRRRARRPGDGLYVPLHYQVLEADHIDLGQTQNTSGGTTIQGVERNAFGQLMGYWLFSEHPGAASGNYRRRSYSSKFVSASDVAYAYRKGRPGQVHGVPWLSPVMMLLRELDEYMEAETVRAKVAACLTIGITQNDDGDSRPIGATSTEASTGRRIETVRPGMIMYLRPGEDMKAFAPTGHANATEYVRLLQHIIASGADMFYAQLSGDLASVNWSSFRAGDRDFRAAIEAFRWLCVIPMLCRPMWRWFIDAAYLAGRIPEVNYGVRWTPPQFMSVDPKKDAEADEADLANGTLTWPEAVARKGYDPEKQLAQIVEWKQKIDDAGLTFAWDRSKSPAKQTKEPQPADGEDDAA